jgi:hypothetical protein
VLRMQFFCLVKLADVSGVGEWVWGHDLSDWYLLSSKILYHMLVFS